MIRRLTSRRSRAAVQNDTYSEYYRSLLHQVRRSLHAELGEQPVSIGVTSASRGAGVSTLCSNLAICAASDFKLPTLIIDANLRRPLCHELFSLRRPMGLCDILRGGALPECVQATSLEGLSVIAAGTQANRDSTVINAAAFAELLHGLKEKYPLIVVDLPSVSENSDAASLSRPLNGVLLVVEAERVRRHVVTRARDTLQHAGANLLGAVLNKRRDHVPGWLYRRV